MIQVFSPSITDREIEAVAEVMRSGWLGLGPKTAEFESKFAEYVGAKYAIGVNSGTAALHLALMALGIGPGDEVLVPTITFASTALAVVYCGATPVFVDVWPGDICIDTKDAERKLTNKTKAIMPVHYSGTVCNMDAVWHLAENHSLVVVEDAAHACGSTFCGEKVGGFKPSNATCFSFHAVKNLTCGEGGMITCNDSDMDTALRRLRWCGIDKGTWNRTGTAKDSNYSWYYEIADLGFKAHTNDIAAAIGIVQLDRLPELNARRREIAQLYTDGLSDCKWLTTPHDYPGCVSSCHAYVIKVQNDARDRLNQHLKECDIATGVHYIPLHIQPYFKQLVDTPYLPVAETVWRTLLTLPSYPDLSNGEIDYIIYSIKEFEI